MLRLAVNPAATAGEVANARSACEKLIARHHLTLAELEAERDRVALAESPMRTQVAEARRREAQRYYAAGLFTAATATTLYGRSGETIRIVFQ